MKYVYLTLWLMYLCISGLVLKAFSEVDVHFILFEFAVVLLWETMTFYWIMWGPRNGDPMGITLLKWEQLLFLLQILKLI